MLIKNSEDDYEGSGYKSPGEDADFAPEGPAVFEGLGLLLAGQKGVFFFFVSFTGVGGGGAVFGEQWMLVFCHTEHQLLDGKRRC